MSAEMKTIIADDIEIVGSIKSASNIQIDGKLNGDLTCAGAATIGNTSVIKGNLAVECVTVYGQVSGNIIAKDKIEMKSTARINGDIRARRLTVEDGVTFVMPASDEFEVLYKNELAEDDMGMATPLVLGDKLLIRTSKRLYCIAKN